LTAAATSRLEAAQALADITVEALNLRPPIDVRALVQAHVQIIEEDFGPSSDCDAVLYGLHGGTIKSLLALNSGKPALRTRFTLGHELGHLLLAWHGGTISCHPHEDEGNDGQAPPTAPTQEQEADAFASRLLVPRRFVASIAHDSVPTMLARLEVARVSNDAGIRSLANLLPPGHVFALLDASGTTVRSWYTSAGSRNPGLRKRGQMDAAQLKSLVDESGIVRHNGWPVWWGRTADYMEVPDGTADWKPILRRILADAAPGVTPQDTVWNQINAVASNANSAARGKSKETTAARIHQSFRLRPDFRLIVAHPEFEDFVLARTRAFRG
jgi:Zn-dependent peptidase ImmA (M78 family)